ncbi:MAG: hypothetical protein QF449_13415 [Alphaproteobacteria bacterium]|nr:hypothetical protein [Alphaproteobacteria bacterium]MDP6819022.1 hypothetical protein [Alphaproteobacteria bacterium]
MSEKSSGAGATKSKASSKSRSADAKSPASDAKPAASDKTESAKSTDDAGGADDSGTKKSGKSSEEKSQKQTVSSSDVHYGYFSSVRTPAYRKGWDEIFGKKNSSGAGAGKSRTAATPRKKAAIKKPITLELDIGELPEDLRAALGDEVRRKVKRRRVNYDKRNAAGAVRWNIVCEIER